LGFGVAAVAEGLVVAAIFEYGLKPAARAGVRIVTKKRPGQRPPKHVYYPATKQVFVRHSDGNWYPAPIRLD
jgi:hypothetical protein